MSFRRLARNSVAALAAVVLLWALPAQAMNVTLTVNPPANACQNGTVQMSAQVTNQPAGTVSLLFEFTANRTADNAIYWNSGWSPASSAQWTPASSAMTYNLWVVVVALGSNHQPIASAFTSINSYHVQVCQPQDLNVALFLKPETQVRVNCAMTMYATPVAPAPPAGQHFEYFFFVQDLNFRTVPNACPPQSTARLYTWRPTQAGQFQVGVLIARMAAGNPQPVATAQKVFSPYTVLASGGLCP
jgi:hypothetical protein